MQYCLCSSGQKQLRKRWPMEARQLWKCWFRTTNKQNRTITWHRPPKLLSRKVMRKNNSEKCTEHNYSERIWRKRERERGGEGQRERERDADEVIYVSRVGVLRTSQSPRPSICETIDVAWYGKLARHEVWEIEIDEKGRQRRGNNAKESSDIGGWTRDMRWQWSDKQIFLIGID